MRIASIALAVAFVLFCSDGGSKVAFSSSEDRKEEHSESISPQSSVAFGWLPAKDKFVMHENEALLVAVFVNCFSGNTSRAKVELLEPTPSFVKVGPICFGGTPLGGMALIVAGPREGDAGKHLVKFVATPCDESGIGGTVTLSIKVKKAR